MSQAFSYLTEVAIHCCKQVEKNLKKNKSLILICHLGSKDMAMVVAL